MMTRGGASAGSGALPRRPIIEARRIAKTYGAGADRRARAARHQLRDRARRLRRDHGRVGQRQEHADEHPRLSRPADARPLPARRDRRSRARRVRARAGPQPQDRLRLPELQPDPAHLGARRTSSCRWSTRASSPRSGAVRADRGAARGRARRADAPPAERAVGRPAAACRHRAGDRDQPGDRPRRRADRQPRHGVDARSSCRSSAGSTPPAARSS